MCGICGYIHLDEDRPAAPEPIGKMTASLRHRGPDDEGYLVWGNIALGMRRLAVIDLQGGHQPLTNESGQVAVICNGEIYNYRSLSAQLTKRGHRFKTASDAEVIVHLYEEMGPQCLHHLDGMFALALYDRGRGELLLARDRLGIKPLHYALIGHTLIFASELKAILRYPGMDPTMDPMALNRYLTYDFIPAPYTIFRKIRKLLPAHYLLVKKGGISIAPYWNPSFHPASGIDEQEAAEGLRQHLERAVGSTLVSDVPLGVFLSGGIDSGVVAAMAASLSPDRLKTFSITFADRSFDESAYSRLLAQRLDSDHHEAELSAQAMLNIVTDLPRLLDEPFADPSFIPTYLLSQHTRRHATVALSGDGGDELFAGYPTYQAHRLADRYHPPFLLHRLIAGTIARLPVSFNNISLDFRLRRFMDGVHLPPHLRNYRWLGTFTPAQKGQLLTPQLQSDLARDNEFDVIRDHLRTYEGGDGLEKLLYLDMKLYLQDDMLVKVDLASMANSLEVRVPLLDHHLVEYVASLPSHFKLRGFTTKYLLKRVAAGLLPREIVRRPKKGFGIPLARWFGKELKPLAAEVFAPRQIKQTGLFDAGYIQRLLEEHQARRQDHRKLLWNLLVLQLWLQDRGI